MLMARVWRYAAHGPDGNEKTSMLVCRIDALNLQSGTEPAVPCWVQKMSISNTQGLI